MNSTFPPQDSNDQTALPSNDETALLSNDQSALLSNDQSALPGATIEALLLASHSQPLGSEQREALKLRVMTQIASLPRTTDLNDIKSPVLSDQYYKPAIKLAVNKFNNVKRADGWRHLHHKAQVKILNDDGTHFSWLLKLAPGGKLPAHTHTHGSEEVIMIEGTLLLNQVLYQSGDYHAAAVGTDHDTLFSAEGCIAFLRSGSGFRAELEASLV